MLDQLNKNKDMNEVSIIINGVMNNVNHKYRRDYCSQVTCDLFVWCKQNNFGTACKRLIGLKSFKKSDKNFEV